MLTFIFDCKLDTHYQIFYNFRNKVLNSILKFVLMYIMDHNSKENHINLAIYHINNLVQVQNFNNCLSFLKNQILINQQGKI